MTEKEIITIIEREMTAYASRWRLDWSDFDGRTLCNQVSGLFAWVEKAMQCEGPENYTKGSEFLKNREDKW